MLQLLLGAARRRGTAVVLVTHDPQVASHADRVVALPTLVGAGARELTR
ncbi:MAG: hypothetical protein ACRDPW_08825 [Mycobacteriales bacterium]